MSQVQLQSAVEAAANLTGGGRGRPTRTSSFCYSRQRYGLDSVLSWPRQYLLLSADARDQIDDARVSLDQLGVAATLTSGVAEGDYDG